MISPWLNKCLLTVVINLYRGCFRSTYFTVIGLRSYRNQMAGIIRPVWLYATYSWNTNNIPFNSNWILKKVIKIEFNSTCCSPTYFYTRCAETRWNVQSYNCFSLLSKISKASCTVNGFKLVSHFEANPISMEVPLCLVVFAEEGMPVQRIHYCSRIFNINTKLQAKL